MPSVGESKLFSCCMLKPARTHAASVAIARAIAKARVWKAFLMVLAGGF
jgi:hypothetical protein